MAISVVGSTQEAPSSSSNWVQTTSIAVEENDVFVVAAIILNPDTNSYIGGGGTTLNAGATCTASSITRRVTNFPGAAVAGQVEQAVWTGVVTGAGDLKVQTAMTSSWSGRYLVAAFRGVDPDDPMVAVNTAAGTSTSPAATAVTPSQAGDWVLGIMGQRAVSSSITSTGGSWVDILKYNSPSGGSNAQGNLLEYLVAPDTSAVAAAPTISTSIYWTESNMILRLAPTVIPGTTVARGLYL